jgi:hypothetical protein
VPLRDDLQDRDAFERRIAQLRHDLQVQQEAAEGLDPAPFNPDSINAGLQDSFALHQFCVLE